MTSHARGSRSFVLALLVAPILGLAVTVPAHADTAVALRWFRAPRVTAYSGVQKANALERTVRMAATLNDQEEDQIYALRGLKMSEDSFDSACSVDFVAGFLDPARSSNVTTSPTTFASKCDKSTKEAILPAGAFVTGLQVCTNGKADDPKVKGLKLWGATLDASGAFKALGSSVSFERTNCKDWAERVNCPSGQVATSISVMHGSSVQKMALRCAQVYERSKTPPDQVITIAPPTWGTKMNVSVSVQNTGQNTLAYSGVSIEVVGKDTCQQSFANEAGVLSQDTTKKLDLFASCTREQAAASCANGSCTTMIRYRFGMTQPSKTPLEGRSIVTFPDPRPQVKAAR